MWPVASQSPSSVDLLLLSVGALVPHTKTFSGVTSGLRDIVEAEVQALETDCAPLSAELKWSFGPALKHQNPAPRT